jgi:hypothetical protein
LNVEKQIYVPTALPYRVQSRLLFKRPNQVPYGRDYNADHNDDYNDDYNTEYNAISVFEVTLLSRMRSQLRLGDSELHNYDDN